MKHAFLAWFYFRMFRLMVFLYDAPGALYFFEKFARVVEPNLDFNKIKFTLSIEDNQTITPITTILIVIIIFIISLAIRAVTT